MIHREGREMMPTGHGSWTVCKRVSKETKQKEKQGRERLLFRWCIPEAAILDFKILKYFFINWQSPTLKLLMFAPTLPPHLWPRTASWSQTYRVKVWHIRGIPGLGTVAGQVCPNWYAPVTQVTSYSQHHSRRKVHVKQKRHHKQCVTLAELTG